MPTYGVVVWDGVHHGLGADLLTGEWPTGSASSLSGFSFVPTYDDPLHRAAQCREARLRVIRATRDAGMSENEPTYVQSSEPVVE